MVNPMARTSLTGYTRQYGSNAKTATPAVFPAIIQFTFDPTAASTATGKVLPRGSIVTGVQNIDGGATGGTLPTIDIGTQSSPGGFVQELDADGKTEALHIGTSAGVELLVDTEIFAGVGASAATGGTVLAAVWYIMADDGGA